MKPLILSAAMTAASLSGMAHAMPACADRDAVVASLILEQPYSGANRIPARKPI